MEDSKYRFLEMPEVFDKVAPYLVPQYAFLQESVFDIVRFGSDKSFSFIDLGAGSGIQIERILKRFPHAKAVYIDSSKPFMELAKKRLSPYQERVQYLNMSFESDWTARLEEAPSLAVSMSAIHHLDAEGKQALYQKVFNVLENGGWFVNIDEMRSQDDQAYKNTMIFCVEYVNDALRNLPPELVDYYYGWNRFFSGWKSRNIDHFGEPKQPGDDIHETPEIQLKYLFHAGFDHVDLFVKYHRRAKAAVRLGIIRCNNL